MFSWEGWTKQALLSLFLFALERVGPPLRQARDEMAAHRRRRAATAESEMGGGVDKDKGIWSRGLQREMGL